MILLLGSGGMLGTEVRTALEALGQDFRTAWLIDAINDPAKDIDTIINCAGAIVGKSAEEMVDVNAVAPMKLRIAYPNVRIVYVSTDCVFSGREFGPFSIEDTPDPDSVYGATKRVGEFFADLVIRTSFIGFKHGLLRWAIDHKGQTIEGWERAFWSGSTVDVVAKHIVDLALSNRVGIEHLSTSVDISKCNLLRMINSFADLNLNIQPCYEPEIDRSLIPTTVLPSLEQSLEQYITSVKVG